ncbi:beta-glucoside operon transcriptional antiterminator [Olsenella profusa DSM 13989]|uniref:CAT RNA-binding domain-containing protein n=1 Tax=Olsenella profusa F0195 TaxID=1125712 RepID=U2TJW2_9ACTN|nr:CAT RNA binding domain-containing protein [Olsenella profusa]ERL06493.1 hypothetical protein HMPREF1316_1380 [Olsenella profusa F0195]MDP9860240.1 beta-glucoside operon transcriptional antiterminator [Olsenella profusa DSM 13989]
MRVIKSINNNAAICADGKGHELIALGTSFGTIPREIPLFDIKRTFYGIDPKSLGLVSELPEDVLEFAAQLADLACTSIHIAPPGRSLQSGEILPFGGHALKGRRSATHQK